MADATETTTTDVVTKPDGSATPKTYSEEAFREVIAARDAAKAKLREREEADKKATDAKLLEEGKLKELLAAKETEIGALQGLKDKVAKYEAAEAAQREKLLKELPKEKRDLYAGVSLEVLQDVVEQVKKPTAPGASKPGSSEADKSYEDMTDEERTEMQSESPDKYKRLYREYYKKKNGKYPPF